MKAYNRGPFHKNQQDSDTCYFHASTIGNNDPPILEFVSKQGPEQTNFVPRPT